MSKFYEPEILKQVQQMELEILRDFMDVCEENGLRYFGFAGTGIGAIRHGGFIPWDDDIDVAMPRADFEKAMAIIEKQYADKYYVLNTEHDPAYPLMTTRLCRKGTRFVEEAIKDVTCNFGIFLDLYPDAESGGRGVCLQPPGLECLVLEQASDPAEHSRP